ncbi:hypothetical protein M9H77_25967 [Catharanthus roseus]|uniref:Uncharacterized protein n=1 Tax=Catharanthus roseus TaxID=4058 RepID=A0ACC0A8M2_CATRO|nr:hypothetical protein M9H77_25967 [Catharanthus roseus]
MQTAIGSLASPKISAVVQSQQQSFGPLKDGFTLAKTLSIQRLEIETDVTMTVSLMNQHTHITHPFYSIIFYCKLLMHGFLKTKLSHVFRKANQCADIWRKMKWHSSADGITCHRTIDTVELVGKWENRHMQTSQAFGENSSNEKNLISTKSPPLPDINEIHVKYPPHSQRKKENKME